MPFTKVTRETGRGKRRSLAGSFASTFREGLIAILTMAVLSAGLYGLVVVRYQDRMLRISAGGRAVRAAHQAMVDQETGLRAYFLTGNTTFLEPYDAGAKALPEANRQALDDLSIDHRLTAALLQTRLAQQAWLDEWAVPARAGAAPGDRNSDGVVTVAEANAFLVRGKELFDRYRHAETSLLAQVETRRKAAVDAQRLVLDSGLAIQLAVCLLTITFGLWRYRRLRSAVIDPVNQLLAAMELAADGRPAEAMTIEVEGPSELRQLARGLSAMTTALQVTRHVSDVRLAENEAQAAKVRQILDLSREIAGSLSLRYVLQAVGSSALDVSDCPRAVVWLLNDDTSILEAVHDTAGAIAEEASFARVELGDGIVGQAARYGRTVVAEPQGPAREADHVMVAVPLVVGARVIGVLGLVRSDDLPPSTDTIEVLETMAAHAASAIEAARLHGRTQELTQLDALTRLPNRRRLDGDLALEVERSRRYQRPVSFIMLDVDHFKQCNDEFGHQVGDEVLQQVATTLAAELRASDTVYRYGGEEFCVLLRDTPAEGASDVAERLRTAVAGRLFTASRIRVTISLGVAVGPDDGLAVSELIRVADGRLFEAKHLGRNRVVTGPADVIISR